MRQLLQHEVDLLPSGSFVRIHWSGGNGPHDYVVEHDSNIGMAVAMPGNNIVNFVGTKRFNTKVWLLEDGDETKWFVNR